MILSKLNSEIKQINAQKAYSGQIYTKQALRQLLDIEDDFKIGFVPGRERWAYQGRVTIVTRPGFQRRLRDH